MVKRKPATEVPRLPPCQIRNIYYDIFIQSYTSCVQNNEVYHLLDAIIPYSSPVKLHIRQSQTSFVAHVRTGLFPPVNI